MSIKFSKDEFYHWATKNKKALEKRNLKEICELAKTCGIEVPEIVKAVFSEELYDGRILSWIRQSERQARLWGDGLLAKKWARISIIQRTADYGYLDGGDE